MKSIASLLASVITQYLLIVSFYLMVQYYVLNFLFLFFSIYLGAPTKCPREKRSNLLWKKYIYYVRGHLL
jgi:hypothetical protein